MVTKTFYLNNEKTVYIKAYMLDKISDLNAERPAVIVFPGGGYKYCSEKDGEPIVMHYLAKGYNAFLLYYSCNKKHPAALVDAAYALYKIRMRADEFGIDKNRIAVVGMSSGGHLAASLATMWCDSSLIKTIGCASGEEIRPNACVLGYPVISGVTSPHEESFEVLLGSDINRADLSRLSIENRVTPKTPPAFIWCTADDKIVSAHNSLVMAKACISNNVPVELHMFDSGEHGLSEASDASGCSEKYKGVSRWVKMSCEFLKKYMA